MSRPLAGRRILVTRRPEQSARLVAALIEQGAEVVELPLLEIEAPEDPGPLEDALNRLHSYDWIVFTSANAVAAVAARLTTRGLPAVASVGEATSDAVLEAFPGTDVALRPAAQFRAEGLLEAFLARGVKGQRFLVPASDRAADTLPAGLRGAGGLVDVVTAYRTVTPPGLPDRLASILNQGLDIGLFTSPSAVDGFAAAAGDRARGFPAGVIGPVTRARAEAAGLAVRAEAVPSTLEGLVAALARTFADS